MFTTVASRTTISWARPTTTSVNQRRLSVAGVDDPGMRITIYETGWFRIH
ncbi:hypothetical protein ACFPRL_21635 [Pseudoclavibacter helvolus]